MFLTKKILTMVKLWAIKQKTKPLLGFSFVCPEQDSNLHILAYTSP